MTVHLRCEGCRWEYEFNDRGKAIEQAEWHEREVHCGPVTICKGH
jgi:hypothetical protein